MKKGFKVGIDLSALDPAFKEHCTRGIGKYAREFQKYLQQSQPDLSYGFFNHQDVLRGSRLAQLIDCLPAGRQTLKQQLLYPTRLSGTELAEFTHLHFLAQTDAPTWSRKPYILTVMDIIPVVCKDLYLADNPNWRYHLARFFELQAIRNACKIITISECSKADLVKHLQIPAEKISVTPLGVDEQYFQSVAVELNQVLSKHGLPADLRYLLYVGGIDPRKNYQGLLESYQELKKIYLEHNQLQKLPMLLLVGRIQKDKEYPRLKQKIDQLGLQDNVAELGFVPDEELIKLYQDCQAMCFFSIYEGFGLTPLEAMAAGATVFSTKVSAMPEVLGDVAHTLEINNPAKNAQMIYRIIENPEQRVIDRELGPRQAKKFSWGRTWEMTLEVYQHAARTN